MEIGSIIMKKGKNLVSRSKYWQKIACVKSGGIKMGNGMTCPEISLLPAIAKVFGMSVDSLLGYQSPILSDYENDIRRKGIIGE